MAFPVAPSILPVWATNGAKIDPGATKRAAGWAYNTTTGFGEYPTMEWVNNEAYNTGIWATYFASVNSFLGNLLNIGYFSFALMKATPSLDQNVPASPDSFLTLLNSATVSALIRMSTTVINSSNLNVFDGTDFIAPISGVYTFKGNINIKINNQGTSDIQRPVTNVYLVKNLSFGVNAPAISRETAFSTGSTVSWVPDPLSDTTAGVCYHNHVFSTTVSLMRGDSVRFYATNGVNRNYETPILQVFNQTATILANNSSLIVIWDKYQYVTGS
jgi:hypothetical protein